VDAKPCNLAVETLRQIKVAGESEWIIDNSALDILDKNPQELIQCTESGDRVVFNLTGVHKFKQTLVVYHSLEFVSVSLEAKDTRHATIFTCPYDGPFLNIKCAILKKFCHPRIECIFRSGGFNVIGFVIENCTNLSGEGVIVVQSNSKVTFERTIFSGNRKRAIYVASNASLTLSTCYFEDNGDPKNDGGVVFARESALLLINNSFFYSTSNVYSFDCFSTTTSKLSCDSDSVGNIARVGGAICSNESIAITILISNFSGKSSANCTSIVCYDELST